MTVDSHTGEIVNDLDRDEAEDCIRHILDGAAITWGWVEKAVKGRAWLALGFGSWNEMVDARLSGMRLQLPREERREAVRQLRDAGMSTRAIAPVVGASQATVRRDSSTESNDSVDRPATVTSLDGRQRPASQPPRSIQGEQTSHDPVTTRSSTPPQRALPAQFFDAAYDLGKAIDRVARLADDKRFPRNAEQVAAKHRSDLVRAANTLAGVLERLPQLTSERTP